MPSSSVVIGALILIPIIIAASAAYIALTTVGFFKEIHRKYRRARERFNNINTNRQPRRKLRRSNLSSTHVYNDSWLELGSNDSRNIVELSSYRTCPSRRYLQRRSPARNTSRSMASFSKHSSTMDIFQSDPKPQPLRIIKRSQTIACSTSPREILELGRGMSGISDDLQGSPPLGADRPLTVHKIRKARGSIFDSMDLVQDQPDSQPNFDQETDPDTTPRARKSRTASAGRFLRSELQRRTSAISLSHRRRLPAKGDPKPIRLVKNIVSEKAEHSPKSVTNVLGARIIVTPEVESIGEGSMWVGVEIVGFFQNPVSEIDEYLHNMHVELLPGRNCIVSEIVGNLYELKSVRARETHLILVKMRLPAISNSCLKQSETMADDLLEQLSGTAYLTVRLTYGHSAFPNCATLFQTTTLRTEATAYIRRSTESAGAPRIPLCQVNPVVQLIETHYGGHKARVAIRRLAAERIQIPHARRQGRSSDENASEHTIKIDDPVQLQCAEQSGTIKSPDFVEKAPSKSYNSAENPEVEIDPARKIWSEMRRTSRGRHHHHRSSTSQGTYVQPQTIGAQESSPGRTSSSSMIDEERNRIKQVALRNKRSVGADTLRSIAPSVGRAKGESIAGGLGLGRSWGWAASWW